MAPDDVLVDLADVLRLVEGVDHGADGSRADVVAALDQLRELLDDGARLGNVRSLALDREPVAAQQDAAAEAVAQLVQDAVADTGELGRDLVRDVQHFLHRTQCRRRLDGVARRRPGRVRRASP